MKRQLWFSTLLLLLVVPTLSAALLCTDVPAGGFLATVGGGVSSSTVTCGPITFSMFQATDASGGTTTGININEVGSSWDPLTGRAVLGFNPGFITSNTAQDIHLIFKITSTAPIGLADLSVGGAGASINERLCTGSPDPTSGTCAGSTELAVITAASGQDTVVTLHAGVGGPVTTATSLWAFKDIGKPATLPGSTGSCSPACPTDLTSVGESFTVVPEPTTFALLGGGLLLFAFARRKRS